MSDKWSSGKAQSQGQQTPYQAATGGKSSGRDADGLDNFTDDMYFMNAKKYEMNADVSKMRGRMYMYNL